jgi:hypothetical protein
MSEIQLPGCKPVMVDDKVYLWLGVYNWSANSGKYAVRGIFGGRQKLWLHRIIAGYPFYYKVEFRNENTFDCRLSNIRIIDPAGKMCEWRGNSDGTSTFTGVVWDRKKGLWRTDVAGMDAGLWDNEIDAARAYNAKMVIIYGDNAKGLNDIPPLPPSEQAAWPFKKKDFKTSGYAGIYQTAHAKYRTRTIVNGKRYDLGEHDTEDAAKEQLDAAKGEIGKV